MVLPRHNDKHQLLATLIQRLSSLASLVGVNYRSPIKPFSFCEWMAAGAWHGADDCSCSGATTAPLRISRVADMNVIRLHNCKRCGKTWFPRRPGAPKICPTCKTTHWDTPRTRRVSAKVKADALRR